MKTLLLMRHAKSSWKDTELADHERPVNKRGKKDALRMGILLKEKDLVPQQILTSSAVRATRTAQLVAEECGCVDEIVTIDRLYMAETEEFLTILRDLPDTLETVMIIGHNPGLETLLQVLSGRIEALPTAVLAHLTLKIDSWKQIHDDVTGDLLQIWRPKELPQGDEEIKEEPKKEEAKKEKAKSHHKKKEDDKKDSKIDSKKEVVKKNSKKEVAKKDTKKEDEKKDTKKKGK